MSEIDKELDDALDEHANACEDYYSDYSARPYRKGSLPAAKAKIVALYDARTKLAQDLVNYLQSGPIGFVMVGQDIVEPAKDLTVLMQLMNKCEEAGLVVKPND